MTISESKFGMAVFACALSALAACSGGGSGGESGSAAPAPQTGNGLLSLAVSDAPLRDARQVCIEFSAVEFKKAGADNQVVEFDPPMKIDLLAFQGMNAAPLLVDETLEAGEYQWVRIAANAPKGGNGGGGAGMNDIDCLGDGSYLVTENGAIHPLYIPSSHQSGLKLNRGFTLAVGGNADFVAEFDLMKSIHAPEGLNPDYIMRPTVKLLDRTETGSIAGMVSMFLATQSDCMPAVYLYQSGDVPDDNEADDEADSVDPIASAIVTMQGNGEYTYEIGPVLTGTYDLAFSCGADDPLADEVLDYELSGDNPVEVIAGQQSTADF